MKPDWIAVDWGTSNFRAWAMMNDGSLLAEKICHKGMSSLKPNEFEAALLSQIESWLGEGVMPVIACGMVGARQGWKEAPYAKTPTAPAISSIKANSEDPRLDVHIISGICQDNPADVMRGEETQIAGFLAESPNFEGMIILPGTHSKWVRVTNGKIERFQTAMTGELYGLLSEQSVLRMSMGEWSDEVFFEAFESAVKAPANVLSSLFSVRAKDVLMGAKHGCARLSGILIGSECASQQDSWQYQEIAILGDGKLARLYEMALGHMGIQALRPDVSALTRLGLTQAYRELTS